MKHLPFESDYRQNFEVVEQRQGNMRLYPHTEQLPLLLRALNFEFYGALPPRIARADQRATAFEKIILNRAALTFCGSTNAARPDEVRLFALADPDFVSRVAVVQQITEESRRGACHRFRFYAGEDFFPEIYLSGKRVLFTDHVLQRFSARVPNNVGEDLTNLLMAFFGTPIISGRVGPGPGFIIPYSGSVLALPYNETEGDYVITTCLTINEIHSLDLEVPLGVMNLHYGAAFAKPEARNWFTVEWAMSLFQAWVNKNPLPPATPTPKRLKEEWRGAAYRMKDCILDEGHGPGSRLIFLDGLPGPVFLEAKPGEEEIQLSDEELERLLSNALAETRKS